MDVAIAVMGIVALAATAGLTMAVVFLARKVGQRDNEFVRLIIDNTMENVMAAFSRGIGEKKEDAVQVIKEWKKPPPAMPVEDAGQFYPPDEDIEEIGSNP